MVVRPKNFLNFSVKRSTVIGVCMLLFLISPRALTQAEDPDRPLRVVTLSSVDENLFALRLLGDIYAHWPDLKGDRSKVRAWFSNARLSTSTMLGQIHTRHLDPDIEILFDDCLSYMSATEVYLSSLDLLDNQRSTETALDAIVSLWDGYKTAGDTSSTAEKLGFSNENAANAGKLVGTASAAANFYSKSQARDASYRAAMAEKARQLEDKWNRTWSSLQTVGRKLTAKYQWGVGEAGFDGFQSPQIADSVARSPRDPFLKARYGEAILSGATTPGECITAVNLYLEAAQFVPSDTAYDSLRLQYVASAMGAALYAPVIEAGPKNYSAHPSTANTAVKLARTYLSMDPRDANGYGHVQLARALSFAGRYNEAVASATTAYNLQKNWSNDSSFCYRYAKLMNLTNRLDLVPQWIVQAYRDGFHDLQLFRTDPDMYTFRTQQPAQYKQLTTISWAWDIKYGVALDDVVVTNSSPFDLTNVEVRLHIRKGAKLWEPLVKCAKIKAGSACQVDNVFSITGDSYDEGSASLKSDQN
jgi:hypothetical protein